MKKLLIDFMELALRYDIINENTLTWTTEGCECTILFSYLYKDSAHKITINLWDVMAWTNGSVNSSRSTERIHIINSRNKNN